MRNRQPVQSAVRHIAAATEIFNQKTGQTPRYISYLPSLNSSRQRSSLFAKLIVIFAGDEDGNTKVR